MKVLIADDNPLILERFAKMVDWAEYGFQTVLTAVDGKKAWQQFELHKPELVITDIQMPRMTGIKLAEEIRRTSCDTIIYFLTSYEEFSYVKAGLELKIHGYLLKHETKKENLHTLLEETIKEIQKTKLQNRYTFESAFRALLCDSKAQSPQLEQYAVNMPGKYDLFLLEADHIYPPFADLFQISSPKPDAPAIIADCYRLIPAMAAVLSVDSFSFLCLVKSKQAATKTAYRLKEDLQQNFHTSFSVLILSDSDSIVACADRYAHSKQLRQQKIFMPVSSVTHADSAVFRKHNSVPTDFRKADRLFTERDFTQLDFWMEQNFLQAIDAKDRERFDSLASYFASKILEYHRKFISLHTKNSSQFSLKPDTSCWYEASFIYHWLRRQVTFLSEFLEGSSPVPYSPAVSQAIHYVYQNYHNRDLSMEMIADHLNISTNYLNTLFRRETGETIWKLVTQVRMQRAQELLDTGNGKMSDICNKTGYNNISYFSKVFKDYYGMTPMEYRRKRNEI